MGALIEPRRLVRDNAEQQPGGILHDYPCSSLTCDRRAQCDQALNLGVDVVSLDIEMKPSGRTSYILKAHPAQRSGTDEACELRELLNLS